jgi:OmpA-OmpF porin, OOP family
MKQKLTLLFTSLALATVAFAQDGSSKYAGKKKGTLVGIHFNAIDLITPATLKSSATSRRFAKPNELDYGFSFSYWKGLTNTIDFSARAGLNFHDFLADLGTFSNDINKMGVEIEPSLNFRPYGDDALISPFLTAGIGAGYYGNKFGAYVPAGIGVQVNLQSNTYLFLQNQYRFTLTKKELKDNMFYSFGIAQNIGGAKAPKAPKVVVPAAPIVKDTDGDGIVDADDKCPTEAGIASLQGCPDADGDGIANADDKCPNQAGVAKYQGCPIPDTDGDGINDDDDKCPSVKGVARYQGCPIPDTDGDGVNDEEDKCVDRKGTAANSGCPEIDKAVVAKIQYAAKNVFFATGSAKLLPKSNAALNEVVKLLQSDETLLIDVDGHTDNTGNAEKNQTLSEARATAVKDYLVSKGIAEGRLVATGYGSSKPVADNATSAGKAKNRRTELNVRNF